MSDVENAIRACYLFNEKAEKLMRLSFIQAMMAPDTGVTISWRLVENGHYAQRYERRGPGEEAIDAFVLTFRFFIQDNELSSFRMMSEHYTVAPIQDELRDEFARVRREMNGFLDSPSSINMNYNGEVFATVQKMCAHRPLPQGDSRARVNVMGTRSPSRRAYPIARSPI